MSAECAPLIVRVRLGTFHVVFGLFLPRIGKQKGCPSNFPVDRPRMPGNLSVRLPVFTTRPVQ